MASFDLESLYTNVPLKKAINICSAPGTPLHNAGLQTLLEAATTNNLFLFNGQLYQQTDGLSMGSPLSAAMANAFPVHHERQWLDDCPEEFKPLYYRRYHDDTF